MHVEEVVGASIANRFPYVVALSYCREPLSSRHYGSDVLEATRYLANVSRPPDPEKVENCGLTPVRLGRSVAFAELPVHFSCCVWSHTSGSARY